MIIEWEKPWSSYTDISFSFVCTSDKGSFNHWLLRFRELQRQVGCKITGSDRGREYYKQTKILDLEKILEVVIKGIGMRVIYRTKD